MRLLDNWDMWEWSLGNNFIWYDKVIDFVDREY